MKITRSQIIAAVIVVAISFFVVFKLAGNKRQFQEDIAFAQKKIESIPVTIQKAEKGVLSENVIATGTLEASEILTVVSETQGKIIKIYKEKGDRVNAGDVIAKVDDEVIAANVLTAEANFEQFQKDVERLARLAEQNAVTKRDLEQAQIGLKKAKADLTTARKALSNTSIKAPIAGTINNDFITTGQFLSGGSQVCEIVDNRELKLNIRVSEREVYKIQKGQKVSVQLPVFPNKKFTGIISSIAEKADAAMKFNIEITMANNSQVQLKSGLYAQATLPVKNSSRLIIEKRCIVGSMEKPVVFIVQEGKAVSRELVTGSSNDKQVEVLEGLCNGDQVVLSGQLNLKDGNAVSIINK